MPENFKVICTGNPKVPGIAQAISHFYPDCCFISRSSGFDLTTSESLKRFSEIVNDYNVFINNSQVVPGTQSKLLDIINKNWSAGHVFTVGSIAEYTRWEDFDPLYTREKRDLREQSLNMCNEYLKTTHLIVGGFNDLGPNTLDRMDPLKIAEAINWILQNDVHIPLLGIEKITHAKTAHWKKNNK